jgi:hypothetical protein
MELQQVHADFSYDLFYLGRRLIHENANDIDVIRNPLSEALGDIQA